MSIGQLVSRLRELDVKLWVDGERLRYSAPPATMTPELLGQLAEHKAELIGLLRAARDGAKSGARQATIVPVARDGGSGIPLSYAQLRLWIFDRITPRSPAYNVSVAVRLRGTLHVEALKRAFDEVIRRHEVLRTIFDDSSETPVQVIRPELKLSIPVADLREFPQEARESEARRLATQEAHEPFDLSTGPLLRVRLLRLGGEEHVLILTMHHIVSDGWSLGVLIGEIDELYEAFATGRRASLPALPIQYADFSIWQREWLRGDILESQLDYWKRQLADLPSLELPTDRPRPSVQTFRGASRTAHLPVTLTDDLRRLSQSEGATLYMTLLAAFAALLQRYSGQDDIPVGTTIANRNRAETESLIGFFVNTLVLRTDLSGDPTFLELLGRVREVSLGAYAHQDIPFEKLVEELQPKRDMSRTPLFQVMFVLQNAPVPAQRLAGLEQSLFPMENWTAKFDLTLIVDEVEQGLIATLEYNTDILEDATAARLLERFEILLNGIVADPRRPISQLPLLPAEERHRLLVEWNQTRAVYAPDSLLHVMFEAQVERTPEAVAVVFEEERLSYRELNGRANRLAHRLRAQGVGPEVLVGILLERSAELVVAVLGVLKAGGAYVPLDPASPRERVAFILEDARVKVLLTDEEGEAWEAPTEATVCVRLGRDDEQLADESEENLQVEVSPENLAYVIYTSGSTGRPKGTLVSHYNVARLLQATQDWFNFDERDVWTLFHSSAFDFSVWEMWGALIYGGRLVVVPFVVSRSPQSFYDLLRRAQVTVLNQTPSAFRQLIQAEESLDEGHALALRLVIFGGEALELRSLRPWFERHGDERPRLVNMYGITETTVHVTYRPLTMADVVTNPKSYIGRAIPDLHLYVLDAGLQPTPVGVPGELCVGGAGLARGYLGRAGLMAEKFIPHPWATQPGARLYRSGDLARYLPDGDIEYLGRIDQQVKIRGFRIEIEEIVAVLEQHENVREAFVLAKQDANQEKRLVAYVVPRQKQSLTVSDLRGFLKAKLPDYMIPSAFVMLEALPLTANGKLNRAALPEPDTARPEMEKVFVAPRNAVEKELANIWEEVLGLDRVGVYDNFFELGGDSIRSIRIHAKSQAAGVSFSVQQLFRHHTIAELAAVVGDAAFDESVGHHAKHAPTEPLSLVSQADRARLPADVEDAYPLAMLQAGMLYHSRLNDDSAVYHNISSVHLRAPFDLPKMRSAVDQLVARHPVLRTSFDLVNYREPLQLVHRHASAEVGLTDLAHLPADEQERRIDAWMEEEKRRKFDWSRAPLLRFHVHLRGGGTFQFSWAEHHVILDGWSVASMITELFRLYLSLFDRSIPPPEPLPSASFRDFVALEREVLRDERRRDFWTRKLSEHTATRLPIWPLSKRSAEVRQQTVSVPLPAELSDSLKRLSRSLGVPLKSVLLAAHLRVQSLLTGQPDVITGLIFNGRPEAVGGERVLGLFLNTLPVRLSLRDGQTWAELVRATFEAEQEILPERRYPLANLQQLFGGKPFFETTFNFVNFHIYNELSAIEGFEVFSEKSFADTNYTLKAAFSVNLATSAVELELAYLVSELSAEQIPFIAGYYLRTLEEMTANPSRSYLSRTLLSPEEIDRQLADWNGTAADYQREALIHQLFEAQVERTPEAVAVVFEEERLSYRELNGRANRLAHRLRAQGVGPEVLVGILLERSAELVVAVLGVLKAGGAYVPLDPDYPRERLALLIEDTSCAVLLTQGALADGLPTHHTRLLYLDREREQIDAESAENPVHVATARNLAYVIFTSGSTGKPKGVLIEHRSLVNYVEAMLVRLEMVAGDNFGMVQPLTVDASLTALYPPLLRGGCVHVFTQDRALDAGYMASYLERRRVDYLKIAPSHLAALHTALRPQQIMPQRWLVIGGEASRQDWVERLQEAAPSCRILNHYGPTEATVGMLTYLFNKDDEADSSRMVKTGRPLRNSQAYVLDASMSLLPVGATGELYIGGECLARGYLEHPELTAEKFIPDPFSRTPGARLYRTGDMVRYLPDGNIIFLGRADNQVKIRGFRIELGEVLAALTKHPDVRDAAVVAHDDLTGNKRLDAYFVAAPGIMLGGQELRDFVKEKLPEQMVPSTFTQLEELPRNPHGKLNPRALPMPEEESLELAESFTPPRDALELQLVQIWESILNVRPIGVTHNFFELGGHSIAAVHLMARVQSRFGQDVPLAELFRAATVEHLAAVLRRQSPETPPAPVVGMQTEGGRRPLFYVHPVGGNVFCYFELSRQLGSEQPFYGLQAAGLTGERQPLNRIEEMAASYVAALRDIQPHGPYLLGGWSLGGVVAFEMAQQLQRQGEQVELLTLIDSRVPTARAAEDEEADEASLLASFFLDMSGSSIKYAPEQLARVFADLRSFEDKEERLEYVLKQASAHQLVPPHTDLSQVRRLVNVFKSNRLALRSYTPHRYEGRVVLFRAQDEPDTMGGDSTLGWGPLTERLEVVDVVGDHYDVLTGAHVQLLAERLKTYLAETANASRNTPSD